MTAEHDSPDLDLFPDAVVVVGTDGVIRDVNDLLCRLARRDRDRLIGAPAHRALRLEEPGGNDWWRCSCLLDADPALLPRIPEQRLDLHREGATPVPVTVTGRRVPGRGGRPDALWVGMRRADRRIEQERQRSDLISTASHELRAPLTSVRGFTKTLLARWDRFDDATRRQMLATIDEDADRVTRLLAGLLDVSRIDAGRLPLRRRIAQLADVVEPQARRFAVEHPDRQLTVDVEPGLPDVIIDPDRIEQVLSNLLDNAVKHGRGAVGITVRRDDGMVRCSVADDGGPIPAGELARLFGKYYRIQDARTSGLGLGLYISRGIVTAHGGRIWARSGEGERTEFTFTVPLAEAHLAA